MCGVLLLELRPSAFGDDLFNEGSVLAASVWSIRSLWLQMSLSHCRHRRSFSLSSSYRTSCGTGVVVFIVVIIVAIVVRSRCRRRTGLSYPCQMSKG
jgi:hypothetical protein